MLSTRSIRTSVVAVLIIIAGGIAGVLLSRSPEPADGASSAPAYSTRVAVSGNIPTAKPGDFVGPIAIYRRHVRRELTSMLGAVRRLQSAAGRHDLSAARRAWIDADADYETIGAAYGAFGDLDAAINGRPGGLQGGVNSPDFTGLHRIEYALWGQNSTARAVAPARRLTADVTRLRGHVAAAKIDALDYALRAHEVLEDTLQLQLAGVANRWSQTQISALAANITGTKVVYGSLRAMVRRRNAAVADRAERALGRLDRAVAGLRRGGTYPTWDTLSQRQQEQINGLTAGAAERLAYVPDIVDPRPPLQPKSAFAQETTP